MISISAILIIGSLFGFVPDETKPLFKHPATVGECSPHSWTNFRRGGAFPMREIPLLNSSTTAIVDDEDYNLVAQFEWCLHKEGHAQRWTHIKGDRNNLVKMHRFIMGSPIGVLIDHRNRNRLDNRRKNLRRATKAQNNYNCIGRPKRSSIYSRFKGVVWCRLTNKWRSQIGYQYKWIHIGRFATEEEAALAYNIKAVELFGEFALLNQL